MTLQKEFALLIAISTTISAFGAGFALYEGSARGNAMGGAMMGKAVDASANFYNPATLTDMTGTVITVGMTTEHPRADTLVNGRNGKPMDAGAFILPHAYIAQQLPYDFSLGLGFAPEFGLGTKYSSSWPLSFDTTETTIEGFVINPNLAYKVTDEWSVSAGLRILYFSFEQYSRPKVAPGGMYLGTFDNHLKGDNGFSDFGWQISSKYDITDRLAAGIMYRSYIDTKVKGENRARPGNPASAGTAPYLAGAAGLASGDASAELRLPQSVTAGLDYDVTEKLRIGGSFTWTQWSSIGTLLFDMPTDKEVKLNWHDVWRVGLGGSYDITDEWSFMMSYVFDICPTSRNNPSTMLPPGNRHIGSIGVGYKWGPVDICVSYGCVVMVGEAVTIHDEVEGGDYRFKTANGFSHAAGVTMSYQF